MRILMFYQSLLSDWNHGNAHFLRGVASELISRGHDVTVYEPADSWSFKNLVSSYGFGPVYEFQRIFKIKSRRYDFNLLDFEKELDCADLVIVHEWNRHELVKRIGECRAKGGKFRLFFHDTHHRSVTEEASMAAYDLSNYDGVLAFGNVIREMYISKGWIQNAWTWHEAADTRVFRPMKRMPFGDIVWIGNWGDEERTQELDEFLARPVQKLGLSARMYGVRYPQEAIKKLDEAGIEYAGWAPNYLVPRIYSNYRLTVHVPRRPYAQALPGIPTIRPMEALACGIPLISAPWEDTEGLFNIGKDFLMARDGDEMEIYMQELLNDSAMREEFSRHGLETILNKHTCSHRVDELLGILSGLGQGCGAIA